MGLFRKKCMYCSERIEKNQEKFAEVKVTGYVGTFNKPFCSDDHLKEYQKGMKEVSKRKGGTCCG